MIRLPRIPRPSWPRRKRAPDPAAAPELAGTLRAFRAVALWGIAVLIVTAAGAAFAESYRGLFLWAGHHGLAGVWAAAFPLQVDLFVAVGELVLFVAMTDRWGWRDRAGAWTVALLGLAASVAGNVGHVAAHDLQSRGTAAVPPLAAFAALWLGLGVIKRIVRHRARPAAGGDETAQDGVPGSVPAVQLTQTLGSLADAVRALAGRDGDTVPSPAQRAGETALLGELLEAVREVGARIGGTVPAAVPDSAESAALLAMRATIAAGNPLSLNKLIEKFGLTRTQAARVRRLALGDDGERHEEAAASALPGGPVPRLRRVGESEDLQADGTRTGVNGHQFPASDDISTS